MTVLASYLAQNGWTIDRIADTASGEVGEDIVASRGEQVLAVEAKGYPSKLYERGDRQGQPKRTNPPTQARHWLGEAILTAMLRQSATPTHHVAIAFPDFGVYRNLLTRVRVSLRRLELSVLVVCEDQSVLVVEDRAGLFGKPPPEAASPIP